MPGDGGGVLSLVHGSCGGVMGAVEAFERQGDGGRRARPGR